MHDSLVAEQVEAYPLEDSLVDHPERRQVNLEVRLPDVYMVTQQEADATPDLVTSTFSLFDTDAHVLVDSGATHSFISREFIVRFGIEMRLTECSMVV